MVEGLDSVMPLTSIGCEMRLADVYRRVKFEDAAGVEEGVAGAKEDRTL